MGERDNYRLPTGDKVEERVRGRLDELAPSLTKIPLTLDHTRRALRRIYQGLPPAGPNNEQFRDCTIWECVLSLAAAAPVAFVTADRAFYEGRDPKRGPAESLRDDIAAAAYPVSLYPDLRPYLQSLIKDEPPIDKPAVAEMIKESIAEELDAYTSERGIRIGAAAEYEITPFVTERPGMLALDFEFDYELSLAGDEDAELPPSRLTAEGSCLFDPAAGTVSDVRIRRIELRADDGTHRAQLKNVVYASGIIGRGTIAHTFRYRL